MKRLSDDHVVPSPKTLSSYGKGNLYEMKPWINGEWGGTFTWNISIRMYINNLTPPAKLELGDYVMLPGVTESGVYFKTAQMFSVAKSSKHPKEAAMLVNFLLNDPQAIEALGLERGIPLSKTAETLLTQKGVIDPNDPVVAGLRQAQSLPTTVVATPYIEDLQVVDQFMSAREKLDQGKPIPQVVSDFRQQVERIVRRLNR